MVAPKPLLLVAAALLPLAALASPALPQRPKFCHAGECRPCGPHLSSCLVGLDPLAAADCQATCAGVAFEAPVAQLKQEGTVLSCVGTGVPNSWCDNNCNHAPSFCPEDLCACVSVTAEEDDEPKECEGKAPATDAWCDANCNHDPAFCPATYCDCSGEDSSPGFEVTCRSVDVTTTDAYCQQNCLNDPPFCPSGYCECDIDVTGDREIQQFYAVCPTFTDVWCTASCNANPSVCPACCSDENTEPIPYVPVCEGFTGDFCTSTCNFNPGSCPECCAKGSSVTILVDFLVIGISFEDVTEAFKLQFAATVREQIGLDVTQGKVIVVDVIPVNDKQEDSVIIVVRIELFALDGQVQQTVQEVTISLSQTGEMVTVLNFLLSGTGITIVNINVRDIVTVVVNSSPTTSPSPTPLSPSALASPSASPTMVSPSGTPSFSPSNPPTPSISSSAGATPSVTPTSAVTPSVTPTSAVTPSVTPTSAVTPSVTSSVGASQSVTPTSAVTPSVTPSAGASQSVTQTASASLTALATPSPSMSPTASPDDLNQVCQSIDSDPSLTTLLTANATPAIMLDSNGDSPFISSVGVPATQPDGSFGVFRQSFTGFVGEPDLSFMANVAVSLSGADIGTSRSFEIEREPVNSVEIVLKTMTIYDDDMRVEAMYQLRDVKGSVAVDLENLVVQLRLSGGAGVLTATCSAPSPVTGIGSCQYTQSVISAAFSPSTDVTASATVRALYGGTTAAESDPETLTLAEVSTPGSFTSPGVALDLPHGPRFPSSSIEAVASISSGAQSTNSYSMTINFDDSVLAYTGFESLSGQFEDPVVSNPSSGVVTFNGFASSTDVSGDDIEILAIKFDILGGVTPGQKDGAVTGTASLFNLAADPFVDDSAIQIHDGRDAYVTSGRVTVASTDPVGLFAYALDNVLVNLAALGGDSETHQIQAWTFDGEFGSNATDATGSISCSLSDGADSDVLDITAGCEVQVQSTHTRGSSLVSIDVAQGAASGTADFQVWFPEQAVISVDNTDLNRIAFTPCLNNTIDDYEYLYEYDYVDEETDEDTDPSPSPSPLGQATGLYQSSTLEIFATFSGTGLPSFANVRVTGQVSPSQQSGTENVLDLRVPGRVRGVRSGSDTIILDGATVSVTSASVTVSDTEVGVESLVVVVVTNATVSGVPSVVSRSDTFVAEVELDQMLTSAGGSGQVSVMARLDDGTMEDITRVEGLAVSSLAPATVTVQRNDPVQLQGFEAVVGAGATPACGYLIQATWNPCGTVAGEGQGLVRVAASS